MSRVADVRACAKLNLALAVTGKRADGYHDLRSVFVRIELADDVRVGRHTRLEVRNTVDIGPGEDLASRAVRALAAATGREAHAFVRIRKRIPLAAGLGGGSSDAAAVLRALATLWGTDVDLATVGAAIGSDVPFFVRDVAAALVTGRGEIVEPLPAPSEPVHLVVVRPTLRLGTAEVFADLRDTDRHASAHVDTLATAFARGAVTPDLVRVHSENDLLGPAERLCPAIASWRAAAAARGVALSLTGSGPTLFAVADDRADALRIGRILGHAGLRARPYTVV